MKLFRSHLIPTLLFIAGEGGHIHQARRLLQSLNVELRAECHSILITDSASVDGSIFDECWVIDTCAPKHRATKLADVVTYCISSAKTILRLFRKYDVRIVLVTGPGFAVVPAIGTKIMGAHVIGVEDASRFESRSKGGRVLYRIADDFFVQHEELLELYPKAKWVGIL